MACVCCKGEDVEAGVPTVWKDGVRVRTPDGESLGDALICGPVALAHAAGDHEIASDELVRRGLLRLETNRVGR